jgi:hypothetical protein
MKDYTTTFTVTNDAGNYGGKLDMSIAISQDSSLAQILEVFERMALALGFSPGSFKVVYEHRLEETNDALRVMQKFAEIDADDEALFSNEGFANPYEDYAIFANPYEDYATWRERVNAIGKK